MPSEQSPLLADQNDSRTDPSQRPSFPPEYIYNRFSRIRKQVILAILSLSGFVPFLVSGCFVPSIPQISGDLDSTPTVVSVGVSISVLASSLSVLFFSAYSSFYGRRVVYVVGMPFMITGSFAVAVSTDIHSLLFWRFMQTFGCAGGFSLAFAAIGDIYELEERGAAIGTFLGVSLFGIAVAPTLGGIFAEFWSWRGFQVALGVLGMTQSLLLLFFFPETAHPGTRGIDKVQSPKKLFVWVNPFRCLAFLRSPNIMAVTLANTFALMSDYAIVTPIAYTVGAKYGIKSEGLLGILLLPIGLGNLVGAQIAGRMSDRVVRQAKEARNGVWIPEDRLRAVWIGGLVFIPISVTLSGFTTAYVSGTVGLAINLACMFFNGIGVTTFLTPIGTYAVDIVPSRSAEVTAALSALRSIIITPLCTLMIPSVGTIGVAATNSIFGIVALLGYGLIWLTIRYGNEMRAYVDVGYPDFDARRPLRN